MEKTKICILGGGFAGIAAAKILGKVQELEVTLIDQKVQSEFTPLLPDVLSETIYTKVISRNLSRFCKRQNVNFINTEIKKIDLHAKALLGVDGKTYTYDKLLIAVGARTKPEVFIDNTYVLNNSLDALHIQKAVLDSTVETIIVSGGGYTGIESATHIRKLLNTHGQAKRIILVEAADEILKSFPGWAKKYIGRQLVDLGIEYLTSDHVAEFNGKKARLANGEVYDKAILIWCTGVSTPEIIQNLPFEKDHLGRLKVDQFLHLTEDVFAAGDCACFTHHDQPLRMSVRAAIDGGRAAAWNIIRTITKDPFKPFKPLELGFLIPLANAQSCAQAKRLKIKGRAATFLHYLISVCLGYGFRRRWLLAVEALQHLISSYRQH